MKILIDTYQNRTDKSFVKEKGCDGVVLGCTEIPLIVRPDDCPLPTLDSTRLLARLALRKAMEEITEQTNAPDA